MGSMKEYLILTSLSEQQPGMAMSELGALQYKNHILVANSLHPGTVIQTAFIEST